MNGSNASFALLKVFGMCNYIVYAIKQFHRYNDFNDMRINLRENFRKIYKNADFFYVGSYSTICNKYSALSTTSPQNMTFTSTHFPVHSSGRGHTHADISATNKTKGSTTTQTAENIFSSMTGREPSSDDLIENSKILLFYPMNV